MLEWQQVIVAAVQIAYSWWIKNYSRLDNKWIPLVNVGTAFVYFSAIQFSMHPEAGFVSALVIVLEKAAETALLATGVHSATKNLFEVK